MGTVLVVSSVRILILFLASLCWIGVFIFSIIILNRDGRRSLDVSDFGGKTVFHH